MNREQKRAWSIVIGMSSALLFCIVALIVHRLGAGSAKPFLVLAGVAQGTGVLACFRVKPDEGAVTSDERDKQIEKNANLAGLGAVYLLVIAISLVPVGVAPDARIPTKWFPFLLPSVALLQVYAQSIATLIQYGRRK